MTNITDHLRDMMNSKIPCWNYPFMKKQISNKKYNSLERLVRGPMEMNDRAFIRGVDEILENLKFKRF